MSGQLYRIIEIYCQCLRNRDVQNSSYIQDTRLHILKKPDLEARGYLKITNSN